MGENEMSEVISAFQTGMPTQRGLDQMRGRVPATSYRVVVQENRSHWYQALQGRFNELVKLPRGWDGYAGQPVSWDCVSFAAKILERFCKDDLSPPSLVPGGDGTLQIEWHKNNYDVELDVLGPNEVVATRYDRVAGVEEVLELQNDFTQVQDWIDALLVPRIERQAGAA
jgi:hypothetical protein